MMIITKKSVSKFYNFFKHPVTAIVIGIIIAFIFYIISIRDKDPLYNISESELIAENLNDSDIAIIWKDIPINNIYKIKLTIWNNGNDLIDYTDFVENKPLTLYNQGNVKILKVTSIKSSRPNIKFDSKIVNDSIIFSLSNSEALEKGDGEIISILYSKKDEKSWYLSGRIKGAKNGIGINVVSNPNKKENSTIYFTIILIILIIIRIIVCLYKHKSVYIKNREIVFVISYILIVYIVPYYLSDGELIQWMK